uniref:Calponin-homology (CH) domain-containing protein n=1 Tax=Xenopus tropicalis TaxID=8364 RepID=A0A6I8RNR3_XENTR
MAGHEWDWFQREELIGQISDIRVQNLQVERENVQKRTFTRWINLHLEKRNPPIEVKDLFVDIQDGKILMSLLEVLTGQSLVKLVSIDAAEIADGNPSLVLGLIWNIILFLQIKELTGNLNRMSSSSSLSSLPSGPDSDSSHSSTPSTEKSLSVSIKDQRKAIKALLNWVQQRTRKYGVAVQDFASSWKSGLAFLALIKAIDSRLVDIKQALVKTARENLEDAFRIAQEELSVPRLLEPEDVMVNSPDEQSIMTYVTQFLEHFPELDAEDFSDHLDYLPLESTFVHYKDGPAEEESKIITLSKEPDVQGDIHSPATHPERYHYPEELIAEYFHSDSHSKINDWSQSRSEHNQSPKGNSTKEIYSILGQEVIPSDHSDSSMESPAEEFGGIDETTEDRETLIQPSVVFNGSHAKNCISSDENRPVSASDKLYKSTTHSNLKKINDIDPFSSIDVYTATDKEPTSVSKESTNTYSETVKSLEKGPVEGTSFINGNGLSPGHNDNVDDACKYIPHHANATGSDHAKQLTVFQPYRASAVKEKCKSINEGHSVDSVSDTNVQILPPKKSDAIDTIDNADLPLISVIPHNLFYYPHYSVPIADVLHAFAENSPGAPISSNMASSFPQEKDHDVIESYNQDCMQTYNKEMADKELNTQFVDEAQDFSHSDNPPELLKSPCLRTANGSTQNPASQTKDSVVEPTHSDNTQISEIQEGQRMAADKDFKNSKKLSFQKAEPKEDFLLTEDKLHDTALERKGESHNVLSLPSTCSEIERDTSVRHRRKDCVLDTKNVLDPNTKKNNEQHDHISFKKIADTCLAEKVTTQPEDAPSSDSFVNIYITILLWLLLYCVLILPELDMKKVTFFANNH